VKSKAKLLIVTTVPDTLATILAGQPRWLSDEFDISIATSPSDMLAFVSSNEGVPVYPIPMVRGISVASDLISIFRMAYLIRNLKPDLVHSYTPKAGLVTMVAAWLMRVPVRIHTFTGLIFPTASGIKHFFLKNADRIIAACATHVVPEGRGVKIDLNAFKITGKVLRVIGNGNIAGVDTSYFDPEDADVVHCANKLRDDLGISKSHFIFAYLGRFNKDKGLEELVEAFERASLPDSALVLFGERDRTNPPSSETWRRIQESREIFVGGFLDDVRPGISIADAIVLPSYREGFPNVLLQGGAMGRPLIATDINGSNEIVIPGETGFLVPVRDAPSLAEAMSNVHAMSVADRNEMGKRNRARIGDLFEQSVYREELLAFYREALQ
jgi:glycosyltransferase involved in cell wall biosynthesis